MTVVEKASLNQIYNIGSGVEQRNLDMVKHISKKLSGSAKVDFIKDRAGHDFRYSVDCSKIKKLGWKPKYTFDQGIDLCVNWYTENHKNYD